MKLFTKQNKSANILQDLEFAFALIKKGGGYFYHAVLTDTSACHVKDLHHQLTIFFSRLNKKCQEKSHWINYMFVIEYEGRTINYSFGEIKRIGEHAHIVIKTSMNRQQLTLALHSYFKSADCYLEEISERNDKEQLIGYLTKQVNLFRCENYNYKIRKDQ